MRLARFRTPDGRRSFGLVTGAEVVVLDHRVTTFDDLLERPVAPMPGDPRFPAQDVTWEPPVGDHPKIFCVGFNYAAHATESGREVPARPTLFVRFPDTLVGSDQPVVRPPDADSLDWEGEVALVVGRGGRRIPAGAAARHIAGYTCLAENSVREWQRHSPQATAGKNWAASGACGPWLVTTDEMGDAPLRLTTRLNGDVVQDDTTDHLLFGPAELIAYISTFTPLRPGDLIATGTPKGIGLRMDPPRFLRPGDELEVEVSGIGTLRNAVMDEHPAVRAGVR